MGIDPGTIAMISSVMSVAGKVKGLLGGGSKAAAPAAKAEAAPAGQTADQVEQARKKRLAALSGAAQGQLTPAGGAQGTASIGRNTPLGQ